MPLFQDGPQYLVDEKLLLSDSVQNLSQWIEILYEGEFLLLNNFANQLWIIHSQHAVIINSKQIKSATPPLCIRTILIQNPFLSFLFMNPGLITQ